MPGQRPSEKSAVRVREISKGDGAAQVHVENPNMLSSSPISSIHDEKRKKLRERWCERCILDVMRNANMDKTIIDRITYLDSLAADDPSEPSINLESLQRFVDFIMACPQMPCPCIGLVHEGSIEIAWDMFDVT